MADDEPQTRSAIFARRRPVGLHEFLEHHQYREISRVLVEQRTLQLYAITLFARSRMTSGILVPSSLAVFMLMASSNWTGCSIGRSAGFAPLRILSAISAERRYIAGKSAP